jgi:hypothetical protein
MIIIIAMAAAGPLSDKLTSLVSQTFYIKVEHGGVSPPGRHYNKIYFFIDLINFHRFF